jgi:DNA-binding beta-propeller fold protein YncE
MTGSILPRQWAASVALILVVSLSYSSNSIGQTYRSPADAAFSPDGKSLAVSDSTAHKAVFFNVADRSISREIDLQGKPSGLDWAGDGKKIWVAETDNATVAEIDAGSGEILRRLKVRLRPYGIEAAEKAGLLIVANTDFNTVSLLDLGSGELAAEIPAVHRPFEIAVTPDESVALVTNNLPGGRADDPRQSASITLINLKGMEAAGSILLPPGSGNVREIVCGPNGKFAYVAHTLGRTNLPTTQLERGWVNTNALSIIDIEGRKHYCTVLLDHPMEGAADPWGVVCEPKGEALWITVSGRHQLSRIDLPGLHKLIEENPEESQDLVNDLAGLYRAGLIERVSLPGLAPRGIDIRPQGDLLAVPLYFTGAVALVDTASKKVAGSMSLGNNPDPDYIRKGEIAFFNADHCFQHWLSCATCHPNEARADAFNWDLLNDGIGNPKNTRSLVWSYRTPPVMSLGVRSDMETAARAGFIHIQFVVPEEEIIETTQAYLRFLQPEPSPFLTDEGKLSESAIRGQEIFMSEEAQCSMCHIPPLYTDLEMYDVGTMGEYDRSSDFDTPTLVELYQTGPYLHDGSAETLEEVLKDKNAKDMHGKTSHLSDQEIQDLVEFLKSL